MSTLINKFLLVGPWNSKLQEIGSTIVKDLYEANYHFERSSYDVLGLNLTSLLEKKFVDYYQSWKIINPYLQIVAVIPKEFSHKQLIQLINEFSFNKIFYTYHDQEIETELYLTLEQAYFEKQIESYKTLLEEQNKSLIKLKSELDDKIEKRTKFLVESRRKLFLTNFRIETFRKTLTAIYKSKDIQELEENLNQELLKTFEIQWVKVFYHPEDHYFNKELEEKLDYDFLKFPILRQNTEIGSSFFMRAKNKPFHKEEADFLGRLTEAVSLSLERIEKIYKMSVIKNHWEATFNAIKEPILIINESFDIIQSNTSAINEVKTEKASMEIKKKKCYQVLFDLDSPCRNCGKGQSFKLDHKQNHFEVLSQTFTHEKQTLFINYYHNVNEKLKMESKILLMAPEAELGILSSSLAHEMNNPLAGLLSFAQLMLMDVTSSDPIYQDLKDIESAAKRARDIIDNLLIFSRNKDADQPKKVNLFSMVEKAMQLFQLQKNNRDMELIYDLRKDIFLFDYSILIIQFFLDLFIALKNFQIDKIHITQQNSDEMSLTLKLTLTVSSQEKSSPSIEKIPSASDFPYEIQSLFTKYHLKCDVTNSHQLLIYFQLDAVNFKENQNA